MLKPSRPVFLNLFKIRFPVSAVMSMGHRVSGVLLFVLMPVVLYGLHMSLSSVEDFTRVMDAVRQPWWQAGIVLALWALCHHLVAGIRFLLADMDVAMSRRSSRVAAWLVHATALVMLVFLVVRLL